MGTWILRFLLFFVCGTSGYYLATGFSPSAAMGVLGLVAGLLVAVLTLLTENALRRIPFKSLVGGFVGLLLGEMVADLISNVFLSNLLTHQRVALPLYGGLYAVCGYVGKGLVVPLRS